LIEFTFSQDLFIAQIEPVILDSIRKVKNKRKALQDGLKSKGYKFGVDWEYFEGKIITFHNLGDSFLPLAKLVDEGSIEVFNSADFFDINEDYERIFKSLLRRCLQQKLYHKQVMWQNTEKLFIFSEVDDEPIRKEHWRGKVEDDRIVFEKTMKSNKPDEILKCKHFAFRVEFKHYQDNWFILIKPDWFFSYDGYKKSVYCEKDADWIKRHEKNSNVFTHLRFISYFLSYNTLELFENKRSYPFITFGNILKLNNASYLDDREWLPTKAIGEDALDDDNQTQLSFLGDL
jgi:hypothetical protein